MRVHLVEITEREHPMVSDKVWGFVRLSVPGYTADPEEIAAWLRQEVGQGHDEGPIPGASGYDTVDTRYYTATGAGDQYQLIQLAIVTGVVTGLATGMGKGIAEVLTARLINWLGGSGRFSQASSGVNQIGSVADSVKEMVQKQFASEGDIQVVESAASAGGWRVVLRDSAGTRYLGEHVEGVFPYVAVRREQ